MPTWMRPLLPGVLGALVGAAAAWLASKGIDLDKDTQAQIVEYLVLVILPVFGGVAATTHKIAAKKFNPGDAATTELVEEHKIEQKQLEKAPTNNPSEIH